MQAQGLQLDDIRRLMQEIWIEPELTAHPTESTRRTILRKQQMIAELLMSRLDMPGGIPMKAVPTGSRALKLLAGWQNSQQFA